MNNREYTILHANPEQRDRIISLFKFNEKKKREKVIIYIAEDSHSTPLGRIVVIEREVPSPLGGKCWYVYDLFVSPAHRPKERAFCLLTVLQMLRLKQVASG